MNLPASHRAPHLAAAAGFGDFARSVLADERTKDTIRKNDDLKKEFPPAPLVTLFRVTDGAPPSLDFLYWFSPKRIANEKKAKEAFSRAREAGAPIEEARNALLRAFHA
jgi:hypothetical protein